RQLDAGLVQAAANGQVLEAAPLLTRLLDDASPVVRGHAAWALHRIAGEAARPALISLSARETDPDVRRELDALNL
ncbi:MAG: HEAT repeat domain-containing protein, partial [Anaerolineae bacterium]|nr:HEAT repeat domain-containing protein [Anaerolineae bacterium]